MNMLVLFVLVAELVLCCSLVAFCVWGLIYEM